MKPSPGQGPISVNVDRTNWKDPPFVWGWGCSYPYLQRLHNELENHCNGKTHYFNWAMFNSEL